MHADLAGHALAHDPDELFDAAPLALAVEEEADAEALAIATAPMPADDGVDGDPGEDGAVALQLEVQAGADRRVLTNEQEAATVADVVGLADLDEAVDLDAGLDMHREPAGVALTMVDVVAVDEGEELGAGCLLAGKKGEAKARRSRATARRPLEAHLGTNAETDFFGEEVDLQLDLIPLRDVGVAGDEEATFFLLEGLTTKGGAVAQRQQQEGAGRSGQGASVANAQGSCWMSSRSRERSLPRWSSSATTETTKARPSKTATSL